MPKVDIGTSNYMKIEFGALGPSDIKKVVDSLADDLIKEMQDKLSKEPFTHLDDKILKGIEEELKQGIANSVTIAFKDYMRAQTYSLF